MSRKRPPRRAAARKGAPARRSGVGERIARDWPLWLGALVVFAVALRYAVLSPGTYQDDDVDHYFLALDALRHPVKFLDAWGMPLLTLVLAVPARLFGYAGVEGTTALVTAATAFAAGWTARRLGFRAWPAVPLLYGALPLALELSFSALAEPYAAFLVALSLAFWYAGRKDRALIVLGLLPLARVEGVLLLGVVALAAWRDTTWRDRFLAALPFLLWALLGFAAHGDPLYVIGGGGGRPLNSLGLFHYARNLLVVAGTVPVAWFVWGIAARAGRAGHDGGPGFPAFALFLFLFQLVALSLLGWDRLPVGRSVGFLRHLLVVFPAFVLVAAAGLDDWLAGGRGRRWVPVAVLAAWTGVTAWAFSHVLVAHSMVLPDARDESRWIVTLVVTGMGAVLALRPLAGRALMTAGLVAVLGAGALAVRAVPPIQLTGERKVVADAVRFLDGYGLLGSRVYVNHPWFAFLAGRDRFDLERNPYLTRASVAAAPRGSLVVWENHYGNRLWGDVEVETLRADPTLERLYEAETDGMSMGGRPFVFRVVVFRKR